MSLIEQASEIAPVYLVLGNHEARIDINEFLSKIDQSPAVLLSNEKVLLQRNQDSIALIGVLDPAFSRKSNEQVMKEQLSALSDSSMFQIAGCKSSGSQADDAVRITVDEAVDDDSLPGSRVSTQEDVSS